jgi:asparagine synthase (glutamine-hydrolysing)
MCGIAGVVEIGPRRIGRSITERIVRSQLRRGPDYQQIVEVPGKRLSATLGHSRLSIIDLSPASNQPMWDEGKRRCIVYNGEVYNYLELRAELSMLGHVFHTQGDTEVVLAAFRQWGPFAANRFIGMFAIAIWDAEEEELRLVRDRFGVKPLYYCSSGNEFYFASTPTIIAETLGLRPNLDYVIEGIDTFTYEREDETAQFQGMKALPPAHCLRLALGPHGEWRVSLAKFYDLEEQVIHLKETLNREPVARLVHRVRECLESAVDLRLRSDVPVGISLSGGVDSSSIASIVSAKHMDVTGFSYGHPNDGFSEGKSIQAVIDKTAAKVAYCSPDARTLTSALWETLDVQGAPFAGGSVVAQYLVCRAAREQGVIVLLGGQGGDETLMGYHKFKLFLLQESLRMLDVVRIFGMATAILGVLFAHIATLGDYWRQRRRMRYGAEGSDLLVATGTAARLSLGLPSGQPAWKRQLLDVTRFSLPTLLRYEDRNSMGNSVESRLPFMDHRFVELGLALPETVKVRYGLGKWVLREAMRGAVPEKILTSRNKRGFDIELPRWIRQGMGASIRDRLHDCQARYQNYLRQPIHIEKRFSNDRLASDPAAFPEAMSLVWLAGPHRA